jgi:hypothetical protein
MKKKTTEHAIVSLCVVYAGLFPGFVAAFTDELNLSVLLEGANYVAEEYRFGTLFNREDGSIAGPHLRGKYANRYWHIDFELRNLEGTIDYRGQNQLGIPIKTQTDLKYSQLGVSVTYQLRETPFYTGIALRSRDIDRRIRATPITQALHETLRQTEWGPIAGVEWKLSDNVSAAAQIMALITEKSTLDVDFLGSYDSGKLTLPRNSSREVQFALHYDINPSYTLAVEICGQRFTPARSPSALLTKNGEPVGIYNYPGSTQEVWSFGVGVLMRW